MARFVYPASGDRKRFEESVSGPRRMENGVTAE
jgi:hypothetical protein